VSQHLDYCVIDTMSRRRRLTLRLLATWPMLRSSAFASTNELRFLMSDNSEASGLIATAVQRQYPESPVSTDLATLRSRNGAAVYLAIGPGALQRLLADPPPAPLVSLFTSAETYRRLVATYRAADRSALLTAIFAEPAPANSLQLARRLYGRRVTVAVLLSDATAFQETALREAAQVIELDLAVQTVRDGENPLRALAKLDDVQAVLLLPDSSSYTPDLFRALLETTYRKGLGVIAYSPNLVTAGTLAAAFATIDETLVQLGEVVAQINAGRAPAPAHARYWRVAVNDSVARSLGIVVDSTVRAMGEGPR
jgi:putative tryptophan/tyrosine transport system substrate-binding protein